MPLTGTLEQAQYNFLTCAIHFDMRDDAHNLVHCAISDKALKLFDRRLD